MNLNGLSKMTSILRALISYGHSYEYVRAKKTSDSALVDSYYSQQVMKPMYFHLQKVSNQVTILSIAIYKWLHKRAFVFCC